MRNFGRFAPGNVRTAISSRPEGLSGGPSRHSSKGARPGINLAKSHRCPGATVVSMSGDWRQVHTPSRSSTTRSRRLEAVDAVVDNSAAGQARTENGINNGATHPLSVRSRPRTPLTFGIRYCFLASPDVHALWITSEWAKSGVWKTALFFDSVIVFDWEAEQSAVGQPDRGSGLDAWWLRRRRIRSRGDCSAR